MPRKNEKNLFRYEYIDDDGYEQVYHFPAKKEVCPRCRGNGAITNPNIGAITSEEWERDWDYEERENYFAGVYDVDCPECNGMRVVNVIDTDLADKKMLEHYYDTQRELRDCDEMWDMERRYGA